MGNGGRPSGQVYAKGKASVSPSVFGGVTNAKKRGGRTRGGKEGRADKIGKTEKRNEGKVKTSQELAVF